MSGTLIDVPSDRAIYIAADASTGGRRVRLTAVSGDISYGSTPVDLSHTLEADASLTFVSGTWIMGVGIGVRALVVETVVGSVVVSETVYDMKEWFRGDNTNETQDAGVTWREHVRTNPGTYVFSPGVDAAGIYNIVTEDSPFNLIVPYYGSDAVNTPVTLRGGGKLGSAYVIQTETSTGALFCTSDSTTGDVGQYVEELGIATDVDLTTQKRGGNPKAGSYGVALASKGEVRDCYIAGFEAGVFIAGNHQRVRDTKITACYDGMRFSPGGSGGNQKLDTMDLTGNYRSSINILDGGYIDTVVWSDVHLGFSPFGFYVDAYDGVRRGAVSSATFINVSFESIGYAAIFDAGYGANYREFNDLHWIGCGMGALDSDHEYESPNTPPSGAGDYQVQVGFGTDWKVDNFHGSTANGPFGGFPGAVGNMRFRTGQRLVFSGMDLAFDDANNPGTFGYRNNGLKPIFDGFESSDPANVVLKLNDQSECQWLKLTTAAHLSSIAALRSDGNTYGPPGPTAANSVPVGVIDVRDASTNVSSNGFAPVWYRGVQYVECTGTPAKGSKMVVDTASAGKAKPVAAVGDLEIGTALGVKATVNAIDYVQVLLHNLQ